MYISIFNYLYSPIIQKKRNFQKKKKQKLILTGDRPREIPPCLIATHEPTLSHCLLSPHLIHQSYSRRNGRRKKGYWV